VAERTGRGGPVRVRRALISVSDKTGLAEFAEGLASMGVTIVSTGRTAHFLARAGVPVTPVADVTGVPEMLEGRVKTLHPHIHAGILADRHKPQHLAQLKAQNIPLIDLVVCNLYPFEATVAKQGATHEEIVENIDIGGPSMVRGACKNYHDVAVVTDVSQYSAVIEELITLAKQIREAAQRGAGLGLSDDEVAFYDALEVNDSAVKVLGDDTLRQIAIISTMTNLMFYIPNTRCCRSGFRGIPAHCGIGRGFG